MTIKKTKIKKTVTVISILLALLSSSLVLANNFPVQSRELVFIDTSAFEVGIDNDPLWKWNVDERADGVEFTAQTPESYYPPAVVNIKFHKNVSAKMEELREVAASAIKRIEKNFGLKNSSLDSMRKVQYRSLYGYEVTFRSNLSGEAQDIKLLIAKSPSGKMLSLMVITLSEKLPHVQPAVTRIWNNINFK